MPAACAGLWPSTPGNAHLPLPLPRPTPGQVCVRRPHARAAGPVPDRLVLNWHRDAGAGARCVPAPGLLQPGPCCCARLPALVLLAAHPPVFGPAFTQTLIVHLIRTERVPFLQEVSGRGAGGRQLRWGLPVATRAAQPWAAHARHRALTPPPSLPPSPLPLQVATWPVVAATLVVSGTRQRDAAGLAGGCPWSHSNAALPPAAIGLALPYTRVGAIEGFTPLPPSFYWVLAATVAGYALATQAAKALYICRFRAWL